MIFGPKIKTNLKTFDGLQIFIGNTNVMRVNSTKFLGLIIQSDLKWTAHIDMVLNKLHKLIGVIYKAKNKLTCEIMLLLYFSFFYPYLIYVNIFWGDANKFLINKLRVTQNRYLRMCFSLNYLDSTKEVLRKNKLMTIEQINQFVTVCFIYKVLYVDGYQFLNKIEKINHGRRQGTLVIDKSRTVLNDKSWSVRGLQLWNSLQMDVYKPTYIAFKKSLKEYITTTVQ